MEEVQSAYWNQSMVTIHPVVIHVYYKSIEDGKETLHHKSFTIISDELSHTASTVFAFLKQLLPLEWSPLTGSNMLIEPPPYSYKCSFQRNLTVQQHGSKVDSP
jgi:hypothetical protein